MCAISFCPSGTPRGVEFQAVKETLLSVKGVKQVHNLHLWALTLSHHVVAVHVAVGEYFFPLSSEQL